MAPLLQVENFTLRYRTRRGEATALDGVGFELAEGAAIGLVGESGCGKTSLANAIMRLLPENAVVSSGRVVFDGADLLALTEREMRKIRGKSIAMIHQAAMNSLNPVYKVGDQIVEAVRAHEPGVAYSQARARVAELFDMVGIARSHMDYYPHEYSGGMKQRAVIAMALACRPRLVIADEPTTALDVITQAGILQELEALRGQLGMSMIYISHDIPTVATVAAYLGVMYAGELVEYGPTARLLTQPAHPYTAGLLASFPRLDTVKGPPRAIPGELPDPTAPAPGCRFYPRCPYADERCRKEAPPETPRPAAQTAASGWVRCWRPSAGGDNHA